MHYRRLIVLLLGALLPILASSGCSAAPPPPGILVITADDLGLQLGSYGDRTIPTPNLDALAARGTRFTRAYVTQPSCSSSRSSFLTGLYPHQNGQLGLSHEGFTMTRGWPILPQLLKQQRGYFTGLAGKLHVRPQSAFGFFDMRDPEDAVEWSHDINIVGPRAKRYFERARGKPFYIQFDLKDPHPPFIASSGGLPAQPVSASQVRRFSWTAAGNEVQAEYTAGYYNSISRLDSIVGRIVEELRRAGRLETTLIIFWGDNGPPFPRAKTTLYEQGIRVPLIIAGPGVMAGQVRDELVSMVDIMPTLLRRSGAGLPQSVQRYTGRDLSPLLRGETVPWREWVFTEETFHTPLQWTPKRAITGRKWKLIENLGRNGGRGKIELYNLERDPDERANVAGRPGRKEIRDKLLGELQQWRTHTQDPLLDRSNFLRLEQVPTALGRAVPPWYIPL